VIYRTISLSIIEILIIKSNNSWKLIPLDFADIGRRLVEHSPGRVFTSNKYKLDSLSSKKSTLP